MLSQDLMPQEQPKMSVSRKKRLGKSGMVGVPPPKISSSMTHSIRLKLVDDFQNCPGGYKVYVFIISVSNFIYFIMKRNSKTNKLRGRAEY